MTKEELAKKRGVKILKDAPSPSEALLTAKPRSKGTSRATAKKPVVKTDNPAPVKTIAQGDVGPSIPEPTDVPSVTEKKPLGITDTKEPIKNKGGRPKTRTEAVKIANIAIPLSVYNDMTAHALAVYDNNLTGYINTLIKRDLDANLDNYKQVSAFMKKAKGIL